MSELPLRTTPQNFGLSAFRCLLSRLSANDPIADMRAIVHHRRMKSLITFTGAGTGIAVALVLVAQVQSSAAPGEEHWVPSSTSAYGITGDIHLSPTRLRMRGADVPLRIVEDLSRYRSSLNSLGPARVLEIGSNRWVSRNSYGCFERARWIVVWRFNRGRNLGIDVYEPAVRPHSDGPPTLGVPHGTCGAYYYVRPTRR